MTSAAESSANAVSIDGRTFSYQAGADHAFGPGDVVRLATPDGGALFGQVTDSQQASPAGAIAGAGSGTVLGAVDADGAPDRAARRPFASATVTAASRESLEALQRGAGAGLPVGTWHSGGLEVPARLRAAGFNRHTFLCGQSGSGKTYALGVLLEQLLLGTELRMVILDPNADFVRLGETLPGAPSVNADRLRTKDVRVLRANSRGGEPLRMRFLTMPTRAQAAVLQLDPIFQRGEYNMFLHLMSGARFDNLGQLIGQLREGGVDERSLAQRIENLGLLEWEVWAADQASASEVVESGPRATVLDLGGFGHPLEPLAASLDLIEKLWMQRESRTPTLIVIDEAHNICSAEPTSTLEIAVTDRLVQIAAEGRKYGLWLLLSTQRPSKIHPQVLSQCDNLALMRMNSAGDLAELAGVLGFAPPAMLRASQSFAQGEALVAGTFAPVPSFIQMGARLTFEGGSDVSVPLLS